MLIKMIMNKDEFQRAAFERMLEGNRMSFRDFLRLGISALLDPFRFIFILMPGPSGYALRRIGYKILFRGHIDSFTIFLWFLDRNQMTSYIHFYMTFVIV